jgi:hypothetical protein
LHRIIFRPGRVRLGFSIHVFIGWEPDMVEEEPLEMEPIEPEPIPLPIEDEPIELTAPVEMSGRKIQAFGSGTHGGIGVTTDKSFKRPLNLTGMGATRCRLFHSKIAVSSMEYMENQINHWIDSEEIEVKSVAQVVGVLEGKTAEPNLIITIWY